MRRGSYASLLIGCVLVARPAPAQTPIQAQAPAPALAGPPPPAATYHYTAYTVFDLTTPGPPTAVANVGGTLTLRPDSTYDKRLSITFPSGLRFFTQAGRYRLLGDSILFTFSDLHGPDVQRGTYRFEPATGRLALIIAGYPPGNQGVYELLAAPNAQPPGATPAAAPTAAAPEKLPTTRPQKPVKSRPRRPRR